MLLVSYAEKLKDKQINRLGLKCLKVDYVLKIDLKIN